MKVICQKWEESERGWGCRPDGYSLHLTDADRKAFINSYWEEMPDSEPDEYSRPDGKPYEVEVDDKIFKSLEAATRRGEHGIRRMGQPPTGLDGLQGPDGWRRSKVVCADN